jgi:eukaryotic-like serine/threonine-protein kinase
MSRVCITKNTELFLAGDLPPQEEKKFIEHLSSCVRCQSQLETMACDKETWDMAKSILECDPESEKAKRTKLPSDNDSASLFLDTENVEQSATSAVLGLLHPTDDPRMLGRIGNYEIIGLIGRGGMGVVFKAFDQSLNRNVAVKVLEPSLAHAVPARQRFAREAQTMASISHENVIPIFAVAEHAGLPYFVMEYADGGTLEQRIADKGTFSPLEVMQVGLQIAKALDAAHRQGLVHRDIKPGNVLMYRGTSRVRVADFGLVQVASEASFTRSGMLAGTPAFMSPEQIRAEVCDHRSDLFSLGTLLYTLCVGHTPFRAETVYGVMQRIVHDTPRRIVQQNNAMPTWLESFIERLMSKSREQRFYDAATVAGILEREIAHHQNPASIREPVRDWIIDNSPSPSRTAVAQWITAGLCTLAALAVAFVLIRTFYPDQWGADRQVQQQVTQPPTEIPSWDDAELRNARMQASALWSELHEPARDEPTNHFEQQLRSARHRADELMRDYETEFPSSRF